MKAELSRIGIQDTPGNRQMIESHLNTILKDNSNIVNTELRTYVAKELAGQPTMQYTSVTRESFLMGPAGGVKIESVWDGERLLTVIIKAAE